MPRHMRHNRHRQYIRHDRHDPVLRIEEVGAMQYSKSGEGTWEDAIPGESLKAGEPVNYYIQISNEGVVPPDNGTYKYSFELIGTADGDGGNTAGIGGLNIQWAMNIAHITGQVPADQVGKIFEIAGYVTDLTGNTVEATPIAATWVE